MRSGAGCLVVALDDFGERVGELLTNVFAARAVRCETVAWPTAATIQDRVFAASVCVVAGGRHDPARLHEFDRTAVALRRPWVPITHAHPVVQIGPVLARPTGPCYLCLGRRADQFGEALDLPYPDPGGPAVGVTGLPDHVAMLAAGLAGRLVTATLDGDATSDLSLIGPGSRVLRLPVARMQGCPRCAPEATQVGRGDLAVHAALAAARSSR